MAESTGDFVTPLPCAKCGEQPYDDIVSSIRWPLDDHGHKHEFWCHTKGCTTYIEYYTPLRQTGVASISEAANELTMELEAIDLWNQAQRKQQQSTAPMAQGVSL